MLTEEMQSIIRNYTCGSVATINEDGSAAVSPKATFVVVDEATIAYGDIRSPATRRNILARSQVEVVFLDVLHRKAVRVRGNAEVVDKADADPKMQAAFNEVWADFLDGMSAFVRIKLSSAKLILSPAYDRGATEEQLKQANLEKLNGL
ncbi:MAG: pyridoxamine 5'-phosphate oxidase family protein [Pseudomonadota bacterium]